MTKPGYSLANPSLKTNYVKILQTVLTLNSFDELPNRADVRDITGITHDRGFDKAVTALVKDGWLKEDKDGYLNAINTKRFGYDLISEATVNTIKRYREGK